MLDFYFKHPFFVDFIIIIAVIFFIQKEKDLLPEIKDLNKIDGYISNIISALVSLAGFILASLTIIVTVKSNIKIRNLEDAENSTELLLTSRNYKNIITAFRDTIIELVFGLVVTYLVWLPIFHFSNLIYISLIAFGVIVIVLTLIRALLVLFKIIFMEFK